MNSRTLWLLGFLFLVSMQETHAQTELVKTIGVVEGPAEHVFGAVFAAAFGSDDRIYVLDSPNFEVRVFDPNGQHVRSFGGQGQGPGEFQFPTGMYLSPEEVTVLDARLKRSARFTLHGEHVITERFPEELSRLDFVTPMRGAYWVGAGTSEIGTTGIDDLFGLRQSQVTQRAQAFKEANRRPVVLFKAGSVDTIAAFNDGEVFFMADAESRLHGPLGKPWGTGGCFAISGDSLIATVDGYRGDVQLFSVSPAGVQGTRVGRFPVTPQRVSETDWRSLVDRERDEGRQLPRDLTVVGPSHVGQFDRCVFDDRGNLWVRFATHDRDESRTKTDVRHVVIPLTSTRAQTHVSLPSGFDLLDVRGDLLLGRRKGTFGVHIVEIRRLRTR